MIEHGRICLEQLEFGTNSLTGAIQGLSPAQLAQVPAGLENSIATLVLHVAAVEVKIAHAIAGREVPEEIKPDFLLDHPHAPGSTLPKAPGGESAESLLQKLTRARGILTEAVGQLTEADLKRELPFGPRMLPVSFFLNLLPFHLASHYGQIQLIKRLLD